MLATEIRGSVSFSTDMVNPDITAGSQTDSLRRVNVEIPIFQRSNRLPNRNRAARLRPHMESFAMDVPAVDVKVTISLLSDDDLAETWRALVRRSAEIVELERAYRAEIARRAAPDLTDGKRSVEFSGLPLDIEQSKNIRFIKADDAFNQRLDEIEKHYGSEFIDGLMYWKPILREGAYRKITDPVQKQWVDTLLVSSDQLVSVKIKD